MSHPQEQIKISHREYRPSAETRIYIERVMANYWIYNMRFGNKNHTLEQIAEGKWPTISIETISPIFSKK